MLWLAKRISCKQLGNLAVILWLWLLPACIVMHSPAHCLQGLLACKKLHDATPTLGLTSDMLIKQAYDTAGLHT